MNRLKTLTFVFAAALLLLPLATPPVQAGHSDWSIGAGFHVGGTSFQLAFGSFDGRGRHQRPGYYYRTSQRIHERGHHCSDLCFRDGRYTFHHASCPLLGAHLSHHRVHVPVLFDRYAPSPVWRGHRYDVHFDRDRSDRWDRHDRYGRHDRYDDWRDRRRHDRCDRHDRYDRRERDHRRRDRGRGHDKHRDRHSGFRHH